MKKVDLGEAIIKQGSTSEIIEFIATNLPLAVDALAKAVAAQNLGAVGMAAATLTNYVSIVKALDKKVNGKKEAVVL